MKGIKKILLGLLLLSTTLVFSQGFTLGNRILMGGVVTPAPPSDLITITTTSTSSSISTAPISILGDVFVIWDFSGDITPFTLGATFPSPGINTIDLSGNIGTVTWTIDEPESMTIFQVNNANITSLDVTKAINLIELAPYQNNLTSADISNNTLLEIVLFYNNNLTSFDISNNTLITNITILNNSLDATSIDNIFINLDNFGLSNGILWVDAGRTAASDTARANLIIKGWTITD